MSNNMEHYWALWLFRVTGKPYFEVKEIVNTCIEEIKRDLKLSDEEFKDAYNSGMFVDYMFSFPFPWKRIHTRRDTIIRRLKSLRMYKPVFKFMDADKRIPMRSKLPEKQMLWYGKDGKDKGMGAILHHSPSDYQTYNEISDYFVEPVRSLAKVKDAKENMYEFYQTNMDKYAGKTNYQQRELVWKDYREVGTFRPTNLAAIIEFFHSQRILDFSAGWGDRLIAAMAKNVERYVGVDPNSLLHPCYQEIINFIETTIGSDTEVTMIESPFETAVLPEETYDLIFTSPPYFDWEDYSHDTDQSIHRHKDIQLWFNNFLMASIYKALEKLEVDGIMVLIITDIPGFEYVNQMISYIQQRNDMDYLGMMAYGEYQGNRYKNPQPMWIFKKNNEPFVPVLYLQERQDFKKSQSRRY